MRDVFPFKILKNLPISDRKQSCWLRIYKTVMETEFKTDVDLLEPIDLSTEEVVSLEPAGQPSGKTASAEPVEQPSGETASTAPTALPPAKRRVWPPALAALAVGCAMAVGAWLYTRSPQPESPAVGLPAAVERAADSEKKDGGSDAAWGSASPEGANGLGAKLREADELRRLLQSKKHEILKIKQNYQYGIFELEDEARRLLKQAWVDSSVPARKNREIELLLQNIQRRLIYCETLEKSMQWLDAAGEELFYLKRRASIDLLVAPLADDIDMQRHLNELDQALEKFQPTASRLAVDPTSIAAPSVDAIAKRLIEQAKLMGVTPNDERNQEIVEEVCSGNVMRAGELTRLSLKGARCLAESTAKQLFLNRLTELSPLVAQKLAEWPGEWLCLNGLSRLDADAAARLSAWQGSWISLNGLKELTVEAGRQMAGWNGRQLELMGLHHSFGIEHLVQWEAGGRRLFVPETLRRTIDPVAGNASGNLDS